MTGNNDDLARGLRGHPGVLVNGKPLEVAVKEKEDEELHSEVSRVLSDDLAFYSKSGRRRYIRPEIKSRIRSSRTKLLSDREIREEYGIMEKKFKTNVENVMWVIHEMGPVTAKEISEMLDVKSSSVSAVVSKIFLTLPEYIGRESSAQGWRYKALSSYSVESLHRKYKEKLKFARPQKADVKKKVGDILSEVPSEDLEVVKIEEDTHPTKNEIEEIINEIEGIVSEEAKEPELDLKPGKVIQAKIDLPEIPTTVLNVKIEVSGTVKVLFGWARE